MHWHDLPSVIDDWVEKIAAPGYDLRQAAANVITGTHVGYYMDPATDRVALFAPMASSGDRARVEKAASRVTGKEPLFLSYQELQDHDASWVKVAFSPALHRAGELGNFFPGQYPGGVPNSPSPVAAMLTSGLIGAGLGWGGGKLLGKLLPKGYGDNLGRTGMLLGGALGAAPGALWGGTNKLTGRKFNDPSLLNQPAGAEPENNPLSIDGANAAKPEILDGKSESLEIIRDHLRDAPLHRYKFGEALELVELGDMYKIAVDKFANTFGQAEPKYGYQPTDVNIDALGRTLWDNGASPQLAGSTMGAMYAAQQMPDPRSRPGMVTGQQLGQFAQNAVGDYAKGYMVGAALNTLIGSPLRNSTFGVGSVALGVIGAVVPRLFGG